MRVIPRTDGAGGEVKLGLTMWHVAYNFEALHLQVSNLELCFLV